MKTKAKTTWEEVFISSHSSGFQAIRAGKSQQKELKGSRELKLGSVTSMIRNGEQCLCSDVSTLCNLESPAKGMVPPRVGGTSLLN